MKHAYLKELQGRLLGSVTDTPEAIEHFSFDQSVYTATPTAVVYPQNTADVRKIVQFAGERAAAGKPLPQFPGVRVVIRVAPPWVRGCKWCFPPI